MLAVSLRSAAKLVCQAFKRAGRMMETSRDDECVGRELFQALRQRFTSIPPGNFFEAEPVFKRITPARGTRLSILQFDTGPKRSIRHLLGAKKINFLKSRYGRRRHGGRVGGNLSIRGPEVSPKTPRVGSRHVQSPTPHAWALPSVHTYKQGPLRSIALDHDLPKISIQSSLGSTKHRRMLSRGPPDPRPIPERVRGPIYIRKK